MMRLQARSASRSLTPGHTLAKSLSLKSAIAGGFLFLFLFLALATAISGCGQKGPASCKLSADCDTGSCQNSVCVTDGVGAPCDTPDACREVLVCNASRPGGYCTAKCSSAGECPTGTACMVRGGQGLCLAACFDDAGCRSGYRCSGGVCDLPCTGDADCAGGEACETGQCVDSTAGNACQSEVDCLAPLSCQGGVCTAACQTRAECPAGAACGLEAGDRHCLAACRAGVDCAADELCLLGACVGRCQSDADCGAGSCDLATGQCAGVNGVSVNEQRLGAVTAYTPYTVEVPVGAFALTLQVQGSQGVNYEFTSVKRPDGTELVNSSMGGIPQPLQVLPQTEVITAQLPLGDDPDLTVVPGNWSFAYRGGDAEAVVWIKTSIDGKSHGGEVALNVFLAPGAIVGVTAANASSSAFLSDTLANWQPFYVDQADIVISDIRYFDIGAEWSDVQAGTQTDGEINTMWRQGKADGLNLFFVRSIGGGFGGIAGIAGGIPGPPLTGATSHSGIAVEVQQSTQLTGIDFCHEFGHFQGLYHLSEFFGQGHDPLNDTPECSPPNNGCGEAVKHMMFPALDPRQHLISPHSARVLQANAGVR